jgi:hypothetical protein
MEFLDSKGNPEPRLSNHEVEERALEAQALLDNPVFIQAMEAVYSRAVGTLLTAEVGSLTASAAHASMKATAEIRSQLNQYVTDHKLRQKYNKGDT